MTFFISGFPGIGKSHLYRSLEKGGCVDSDSSKYSKLEDGSVNPNFIEDYFNHLNALVDSDTPLVFISTHEAVLKELKAKNFKFTIVIPKQELKEEYLARYKERGSPQGFIDLIDRNWDSWLEDIKSKYDNVHELSSGETLTDYVNETSYMF